MDIEKLKFPIGQYTPGSIDQEFIQSSIGIISSFPERVKTATMNLNEMEWSWRYRPEGWSISQVVHHCADSHMNSFIRFKLAMTEDQPTIKPYDEGQWAEMTDYSEVLIESSLKILEGLHKRWGRLLSDMSEDDWDRVMVHPEHGGEIKIGWMIGLYKWHCEHHLAHIHQAIESKGIYG